MSDTRSALDLAHAIARREITAEAVVRQAVEAALSDPFCAFTRVLASEAIAAAQAVDRGEISGPLAGVPFAVKDLFDVAGQVTTAGARLHLGAPAASEDAEVVRRLKAAGAILIGTLNMDEFAYGFATVNAHFGTTQNPHDPARLAGGSSGGSAAAVAAGFVPLSLGSDTNGSVRVPASLCGVWGMRPAQGAVPLNGVFPFVEALDTVGPFARGSRDLRRLYEVLAGETLTGGSEPLRVARLDGFFARNAAPEAVNAVDTVMTYLGSRAIADLPQAEAGRSAGFVMTAALGGALHLDTLRARAQDYDPAVRDRLIAGAMLPAAVLDKALRYRDHYRRIFYQLFDQFDVLIAPATPCPAPLIEAGTILIDGKPAPARAHLGIYAQAISLAGVPVIAAPLKTHGLPIGLQIIMRPGLEGAVFGLMHQLEDAGVLGFTAPGGRA
ncbi:AtzE family amidohydrolase [Asticcacaulis excentricus]|uniref:Amidohydrolase, AtzE family n=1 Tax=Asticcacaulis excentricus (strain ATCC 15261 / DSM 4724 / KCTC 12464 / NCIMB 9791 / VKM B-1370 / CB 48) TaxID=573065 RepID=E8RUX3_ASTEC|nr:AtzE family amidohydrolase [Asticcacaulis excentricus]ADU14173.1 amidohydrolase, AtzE family [Asticcacaulis excentricus CB 48]